MEGKKERRVEVKRGGKGRNGGRKDGRKGEN